ncbi:MAG: hypothetical protein LBL26_09455 [Peptococcaceae bacterium]|jgi:hypothetical protein|nr:hypothetical protein [Peptococcaceae bacterium]
MGKMIDLSIFEEDTLDIKLPGLAGDFDHAGEVIHVRKPRERMVLRLNQFVALEKEQGPGAEETDQARWDLALDILNDNKDGIVFDRTWMQENLSWGAQILTVKSYYQFTLDLESNPNFTSPSSRKPAAAEKRTG